MHGLMIHPEDTVRSHMTLAPVTIPKDATIHDAACTMFEHKIRHLPVMDGEKVAGVISDGDVAVVNALPGIDAAQVSVFFAMTTSPYICSPDAPLLDVVRTLRERKIGSALVMQGDSLVGIFSVIDALRVFESQLQAA